MQPTEWTGAACIPHPIGSLTEDQLRERAKEIAPEIKKLLTEN